MATKRKTSDAPEPSAKAKSLTERGMVSVAVYMKRDLRKRLKARAADEERPVSKVVVDALEAYLAKPSR